MLRLLLAVPLALLLLSAPVQAQSVQQHVSAAKRAEKSNNWKKALGEWQAAYKISPDAEYLVGMGDAYAKLGDKANAKKQYEAYLADPLALDGGKVKAKIAALDKPSPLDDLGGLDIPSVPAAKPAALGMDDLGLDLGAAPTAKPKKDKKGKKDTGGDLGLDLEPVAATPPKKPAATANNDLGLGLDLAPVAAAAPKKPTAKPNSDLGLDLEPVAATTPKKPTVVASAAKPKPKDTGGDLLDSLSMAPTKPAAASPTAPASTKPSAVVARAPQASAAVPGTKVAVTTRAAPKPPAAAKPPEPKAAPPEAVSAQRAPKPGDEESSGKVRILAYVTAGAAVAGLAVGGLYFSKASQDNATMTERAHSGAEASALLEQQKTHKSLSFAGFATGLVLASVATALFTF